MTALADAAGSVARGGATLHAAAPARLEYFPAVDGLRALAVLAVVAYHLNGVVPSGFVGVDIFFVISGFVVAHSTAHLPTSGTTAFIAAFYARRLLRIAPALVACVLLSLLATALFVPDAWLSANIQTTALGGLVGASNYVLAFTANDYWAPRSEFNPFTHTWSLGVEEQFYLLAPLLFWAWRSGRRRRALSLLCLLGGLSLLMAALAPTLAQQTLAFYSIHTRFWELAVGVGLAMSQAEWRTRVSAWSAATVVWLSGAALALVGACLVATDAAAFPWPWALLPVGATALLILLVVARPQAALGRLFASRPCVWLGRLSYSLYLWHWPVFVLMRWTVGIDTLPLQLLGLGLAIALAMASLRLVERPFRQWRFGPATKPPRVVFFGLAGLCAALVLSALIGLARPHLSLSVTRNADWKWTEDFPVAAARCGLDLEYHKPFGGIQIALTPRGCEPQAYRLFVVGDSHAGAYLALLKMFVRAEGVPVRVYSYPGCNGFSLQARMQDLSAGCREFTEQVVAEIAREARAGDVLFLPGLRIPRLGDQWSVLTSTAASDETRRAVAAGEVLQLLQPLAARQVGVLWEAPKPVFAVPPFRCADWFNAHNPVCRGEQTTSRERLEAMRAPVNASMAGIVQGLGHAAIYDPFPLLCPPGERCLPALDGRPLFLDGDHLSGFGNAFLYQSFRTSVLDLRKQMPATTPVKESR
jgi:peptidoglycan/LPS O-acetylase OafA/YrhL